MGSNPSTRFVHPNSEFRAQTVILLPPKSKENPNTENIRRKVGQYERIYAEIRSEHLDNV